MTTSSYQEPPHPVTGQPLSDLERELWRLRMIAHEAQVLLRGLHLVGERGEVTEILNEDIFFTLSNHAVMLACKFLEIWDSFGRLETGDARVRSVRRAVQPFVGRIRTWGGLGQFRSSALAHAYLTKKGEILQPWKLIEQDRIPSQHAEQLLLLHCVTAACAGVLAAYPDEYRGIQPLLGGTDPTPIPAKGILRGSGIAPDLRPLAEEANRELTALGVPMSSPVFVEFRKASGVTEVEARLKKLSWWRRWLRRLGTRLQSI